MPPRKQPPQQDLEEEDDALVTSKQFKEMMHMMESLTASMNKTFKKTTTSMNEMFHKSQASTDTTLERVQRGIAAMADRVQALETRLPIAATGPNVAADPNVAAADTHVDGDPFAEDPRVDNDEHSELCDPPPCPRRPFNRQGMRGNPNYHNQHYVC
jgi:Tfp pilus assembly protein PilO